MARERTEGRERKDGERKERERRQRGETYWNRNVLHKVKSGFIIVGGRLSSRSGTHEGGKGGCDGYGSSVLDLVGRCVLTGHHRPRMDTK